MGYLMTPPSLLSLAHIHKNPSLCCVLNTDNAKAKIFLSIKQASQPVLFKPSLIHASLYYLSLH